MGTGPSTPRWGGEDVSQDTAEFLIGTFVGGKSFPLNSDYWQKLLELPFDLHWPASRVEQACHTLAQNNSSTRHLAKILVHLTVCLQESVANTDELSVASMKAVNASYISSVFLKYSIENMKTENFDDLHLSLEENETIPDNIPRDESIVNMVMHDVLNYIGRVDISPKTYLLHHELLNVMLVAMSTQLLSGPSPGPNDVHPFLDAAMSQDSSLVGLAVHKLLLNYISRPRSKSSASYALMSEESQLGVLKSVGSAAANIVLFPLTYFVNSSVEASRSHLAHSSINILLIPIHYRKCILVESVKNSNVSVSCEFLTKDEIYTL